MGLKSLSVSCSDLYISDDVGEELYKFDQADAAQITLEVSLICDMICERARSSSRDHRVFTSVMEWEHYMELHVFHLSQL